MFSWFEQVFRGILSAEFVLLFFSEAWRRRRRRRRRRSGKMDESEMETPDVHNQDVSAEAKRKIISALFDDELHDGNDEQEEYDVHPKHAPVRGPV